MLKDEKISLIASAKQLQNTISINAVNSISGEEFNFGIKEIEDDNFVTNDSQVPEIGSYQY